jgi:sec-independent protein translocase protein TatB
MFDIGWQEIIILMLIALIVVGPKDLPRIVKTAGQWMGKARGYARDFQRTIEEAADATEIDAVKKEIDEANRELTTARRDVAEGTDSMNKMFSEDVGASSETAAAKANGGAAPEAEAAAADGDRSAATAPAADGEAAAPEAAPAPAADTQGDGADGTPARGASA